MGRRNFGLGRVHRVASARRVERHGPGKVPGLELLIAERLTSVWGRFPEA